MNFKGCRNVYPLRCIKPYNRYKYDEQRTLKIVFNEISNTQLVVDNVICDNPKRSIIRNCLSHSSSFACEYYVSSAISHVSNELKNQVEKKVHNLSLQIQDIEENLRYLLSLHAPTAGDNKQIATFEKMKNELEKAVVEEKKNKKVTSYLACTYHEWYSKNT